jgi:uncharacterized protein
MKSFSYKADEVILGRLERGDDLLSGLTDFCTENAIQVGNLSAIGAVEKGSLGFYDQAAGEYRENNFDLAMEIASLNGNISLKAGKIFLHCHVVLADRDGRCFGGHLMPGNTVFACEFVVNILEGQPPERKLDDKSGLYLW